MTLHKRRPAFTLTDTGPLIGLVDDQTPEHTQIVATLAGLPKRPMLTTWPCFTEAMYLLHKSSGTRGRKGCGATSSGNCLNSTICLLLSIRGCVRS